MEVYGILMDRKLKGVLLLILLVFAIIVGGIAYFLWDNLRQHEETNLSITKWKVSGDRMKLCVYVYGLSGEPINGVEVKAWNSSGCYVGKTDVKGKAVLTSNITELESIYIGKIRAISRPYAYYIGQPDIEDGLDVIVYLK